MIWENLLLIGQFEPSTKICNIYGYHNRKHKPGRPAMVCLNCNTNHDIDINAAINIKKFALQEQNLIGI
ncbi:zinc ribbon domain-containing protein [Methanosalsum zhilinae]|uniref:zinc ribbon domain-containing protein n=1 Tax=Methanosalsum zhilinae TaxID=39669 RepID=UPI0006620CC2|nr:zinc ribbon domain-containing protein [Methanosalsum zhilinae]